MADACLTASAIVSVGTNVLSQETHFRFRIVAG